LWGKISLLDRNAAALLAFVCCAAAAEPTPLPPLVVTGVPSPRPESQMPASIGVVDTDDLHVARPGFSLAESLERIPGIVANDRQNYAQDLQIQSRGFGARSSFGVRGVQLRLDELPVSAPDGQGQSSGFLIAALDRVEVLRGPLAFQYGNSAGGVISAFSREPPAAPTFGASIGAGADQTWRFAANAGGQALDGALGYRLDVQRLTTDGSREHSAAERNQIATMLSWKELRLYVNTLSQPRGDDPQGLTREQFESDPHQAAPSAKTFDTRKTVNDRNAGLRWSHAFGDAGALDVDAYGGHRGIVQFQSIPKAAQSAPTSPGGVIDLARDTLGGETRWRQRLGSWTVRAGLQLQSLGEDRRGYENFVGDTLGVPGALRRDEHNRVGNFDQFLTVEEELSQRWHLLGAVRHSRVDFESDDRFISDGNPDDSGQRHYAATTPAVAVQFLPRDASNLYVNWGEGFETPTFNELSYRPDGSSGLNFALDASRSRTLELGWKEALAPGQLATLALFDTRTRDEIVPATNSGGRAAFANADGTRRRGAEASVETSLPADLSLQVAADYLDAQFTSAFTYVANGAPVTVPSGNRIPGVARAHAYAELAWRRARNGWSAALDARHSRAVAVNDVNSDAAPDFTVAGAYVRYERPASWGRIATFVRGDNLFDEDYAGSVIVNEANGRFFEPAPGRGWFAGVEVAFTP
jgi:iron complex outermembrane receptor protein